MIEVTKPHAAGLPEVAYATSRKTGLPQVVSIYAGDDTLYACRVRRTAAELNRLSGVTPAQAAAMMGGVEHGWKSPEADPANYDENGNYKGVCANA